MYMVQSFIYSSMSIYPCLMGNPLNTWPEVRTQKQYKIINRLNRYQTRIQFHISTFLTQVSCNVLWSYISKHFRTLVKDSKNAKCCPPIPSLIQFVHGHYRLTGKMCCSETFEVFLMNCVSDELFLIVTVCSPYICLYLPDPYKNQTGWTCSSQCCAHLLD